MNNLPPRNSQKKYPAPFSLRLTFDERAALEKAADGRSLGAYIRWVLFKDNSLDLPKVRTKDRAVNPDRQELAKLLGAIGRSRISQNINQLAKAVNTGSLPVNYQVENELNEACEAIRWMRETLIKAIGLKPITMEDSDDPQR